MKAANRASEESTTLEYGPLGIERWGIGRQFELPGENTCQRRVVTTG